MRAKGHTVERERSHPTLTNYVLGMRRVPHDRRAGFGEGLLGDGRYVVGLDIPVNLACPACRLCGT